MRRRTVRTLLATIAGALVGGVLVFALLAAVGKRQRGDGTGVVGEPIGTSPASPAPAAASPVASPSPTPIASPETAGRVDLGNELGIALTLPEEYRLAAQINALGGGGRTGPAQVTITKAALSREEAYVRTMEELAERQVATDAPVFAPAETIVFHEITSPTTEANDSPYARTKEGVKTASGLLGTRYKRVQGIHTYDMTYFTLPSGKKVGVQMSYNTEAPEFDEAAYAAVLRSIEAR